MGVAAGFTGSQIGTDESIRQAEEEHSQPAEVTQPSESDESPKSPEESETATLGEGDEDEEHADVQLGDERDDRSANSGTVEEGSVEYGA